MATTPKNQIKTVEHLNPSLCVGAPVARPRSAACAGFAQPAHTTMSGVRCRQWQRARRARRLLQCSVCVCTQARQRLRTVVLARLCRPGTYTFQWAGCLRGPRYESVRDLLLSGEEHCAQSLI